jgi:hypothetical protein
MLADVLLVGHHSGCSATRDFWDRPPVVTSILMQGYDNRGLVLLCVYLFSILWICIDFLWCTMLPQIVTRTAGSIASKWVISGQIWRHHPVPSGNYTNQLQVSWGAKFKFLLDVDMNNFIIEHTTDNNILLLVPQDHRNIFQAHWANLKALDLALGRSSTFTLGPTLKFNSRLFINVCLYKHFSVTLRRAPVSSI